MGGSQSSKELERKRYISPIPGTFGAPAARKDHITVYNDKIFCYVPIKSQMNVSDVKAWLASQSYKDIRLFHKEKELDDHSALQELGLDETCMLRAVSNDSFKTDGKSQESLAKLSTSSVSFKSCPVRDFSFTSTPDQSYNSSANSSFWEIDFSVYAVPEAGCLTNKVKKSRVLVPISECILEEDVKRISF
jgi:hypothetical protein